MTIGLPEHDDTATPSDRPARSPRLVNRLRRSAQPQQPASQQGGPAAEVAVESPHWLPPGRPIELAGRGTTWIHEMNGPGQAPGSRVRAGDGAEPHTLFLLHGWTATGALNWFPTFADLGRRFRVVTIDHRGHGRGIRNWHRFRLEDCADDLVAVADELGIERFIPVGYSMGGPIAQLAWRRHRDRVEGMVLCATARSFTGRPGEKALFGVMAGLSIAARLTPGGLQRSMNERVLLSRFEDTPEGRWAVDEMRRHDPRMIVEAGQAIGRFTSHSWIGGVDVPSAVVVTEYDSVVPAHRQRRLAASIPGATVHEVRGDHTVCVLRPYNFVPALVEACISVTARASRRSQAAS